MLELDSIDMLVLGSVTEILLAESVLNVLFLFPLFVRALDHPRERDGGCFQMRISYSPAAPIFLFLVQWADYRLAGALGLLRVLIYVVCMS